MAASRERNDNSYADGGGFGKFPKRPFRRVHTTPYDRPPTAIRNPSFASNNDNNNGWLSKLVDPAQRLIASSAHKLFASVFRKRLPPPPPPQPPELEANGGEPNDQEEAVPKDPHGTQQSAMNEIKYPASSSNEGGLTELELILKQKTYTRSEIDRLTALLQSRIVDQPVGTQERKSEVIPSKPVLSQDRKEELPVTPIQNGPEGYHISTSLASSSVLDEDVASPAELAKAYMGSRPSKISPSVLSLRGRPAGEDSVTQIDHPFPSKSPILSVVPRSSGPVVSAENGFVTPRSRGRSAIYSMARTPYSRSHLSSTHQGAGMEIDIFGAPSWSSQSMRDNGRFSVSKQGASKRRSSVLDNDIGSVGPIRRIRQKSNLVPSGTPSVRGTGLGSNAAQLPSSSQKPALASERLTENGDNSTRGSGNMSVPSKSSEMASKILQQLDVLVSSRDKSPTKLSPSMLRGPALKSLETVDSSKFLETVQDNNRLDVSHGSLFPNMRGSVSQKEDKVEGNGSANASYDKSASALNGVDSTSLVKINVSDVNAVSSPELNSLAQRPPQKKQAFQMSAHEDYLELDDDDHSDRIPSTVLAKDRDKVDDPLPESKNSSTEALEWEKPAAFSQGKTQSSSLLNQNASEASDGFIVAEKTTGSTTAAVPLPAATGQQAIVDNQVAITSDKSLPTKNPDAAAPKFSFGEKAAFPKEPNGFPPTSDLNSKTGGVVPVSPFSSTAPLVTGSMGINFGISSEIKSENASSLLVDSTKPLAKESESDKADNNNLKFGVFASLPETVSSAVSTSPSTTSIFSFGGMPTNSSSTNGYVAANPPVSSSGTALFSQNITGQNSSGCSTNAVVQSSSNATASTTLATNTNGISKLSASASSMPSFVSGPVFKFGPAVVQSSSTSSTSTSATAVTEPTEAKTKETSFGNLMSAPFGNASSAISSTGHSLFSGAASAIKGTGSSIFDGSSACIAGSTLGGTSSAIASTGSSIFSFNAGASTSAVSNQSQGFNPYSVASTQAASAGTAFGSSASAPAFGLTANATFSSGSSLFNSSTSTDKLFGSGATFGLASSTSETNSVSSTTSSTSGVFGSGFQTPKSSIFGSAGISSASSCPGFAFGESSGSNAATSNTSMGFGLSTGAASGSVFKFGSPATATPSHSVFATPNSSFTFGSSPSNNDQMNMEDSMAEDTVQATTSTAPVFDQQSVTPPPSGFVFGSTTPSGGNQFGSTAPSGGNPFQFGSQPNLATPQNQSPFQASGSLEFNAGGSFSLGTGGGDKSNRKFVRVSRKARKK